MDLRLLPPGFHFTPTAEELLFLYLHPRKNSGPNAVPGWGSIISDVDLYGEKEPWFLFPKSQEERLFYVFTDLKKVSRKDGKSKPDGKNNVRSAGSGFWWGRAAKPVKDSDDKLIGMDHYYTFETKKKSKNQKKQTESGVSEKDSCEEEHGHWTMHEYSLVDENGDSPESMVVCVVGCDTQINIKHSVAGSPSKKKRRFPASKDLGQISSKGMCTDSPSSVLVLPEKQEQCLGAENEYFTVEEMDQRLQEDQQMRMCTDSPSSVLVLPEKQESCLGAENEYFTLEEMDQRLQEDQQMTTNSALLLPECKDPVLTAEDIEQWIKELYQEPSTNSALLLPECKDPVLIAEDIEQWIKELYQEPSTNSALLLPECE